MQTTVRLFSLHLRSILVNSVVSFFNGAMALTSGSWPLLRWSKLSHICLHFSRRLILLLLLVSGIHPNPGPPPSPTPRIPLPTPLPTFLQWNCNGILNKANDLRDFLYANRISIAAIQETKLKDSSRNPSFPGYNFVFKNRQGGGGGGLAFLIHHSISFSPVNVALNNDPHIELQAIKAQINNSDVTLFNVYVLPASSCPPLHRPNIASILDQADDDEFILGDFNAHHSAWDTNLTDARGRQFVSDLPTVLSSCLTTFRLLVSLLPLINLPPPLTSLLPLLISLFLPLC